MDRKEQLRAFCTPYYANKDIMHNLWHIELMERWVEKVIALGDYSVDREALDYATWFHGFIYSDEQAVRAWLEQQGFSAERISKIVQIAWESQRPEVPETLEGKILHDAHVLEGGKTYVLVKTLITGSVRGQSLEQTLDFFHRHVLGVNRCYLPETIPLCQEMEQFTEDFLKQLEQDIK